MKISIAIMFVGILCSSSVPAQTNPLDLPPFPFSLPASTEPQSAWYLRDAALALELHAASTNAAVITLLGEIRDMKQKLTGLEAEAWRKDPMLLTCDQFIGKTHDWVMAKHQAEMDAAARFFLAVTNRPEAGERRTLENDLSLIMNVILLKEQGDNTNFAPLIKSTFDNLEMIRLMDTNSVNTNSATHPERGYFPYWQCDRLIGYRPTSPLVLTNSFAEVMKEFGKRYDLALARRRKSSEQTTSRRRRWRPSNTAPSTGCSMARPRRIWIAGRRRKFRSCGKICVANSLSFHGRTSDGVRIQGLAPLVNAVKSSFLAQSRKLAKEFALRLCIFA